MGKQRIRPNYRRPRAALAGSGSLQLAVLNSLGSPASRRVCEYAIDQFIAWYCSEPHLAFNPIVVVLYRMHLESRGPAANTSSQQLAAVRHLAHEATDSGLMSPQLAAGISLSPGLSLAAETVRGAAAMPPARQHESDRWQESDEATSRQNACGSRPVGRIALAGAPLHQIQLLIQPFGAEPNSGSCNLGQPFRAMMRSIDGRTLTRNGPTAVQSLDPIHDSGEI
jgi:hypothetical protein